MAYYDLGAYIRAITTKSPDTQLWFDRGLNWLFGFNHAEAIKCFGKALETDPGCAMAHWGIAYAAGPNYNLPWHLYDPAGKAQALAAAYDAMQNALKHASGAMPGACGHSPFDTAFRSVSARDHSRHGAGDTEAS